MTVTLAPTKRTKYASVMLFFRRPNRLSPVSVSPRFVPCKAPTRVLRTRITAFTAPIVQARSVSCVLSFNWYEARSIGWRIIRDLPTVAHYAAAIA